MRVVDGRPDLSPLPLAELVEQAYALASDIVAPLPDDHRDGLYLLDVLWELRQRITPTDEPGPRRPPILLEAPGESKVSPGPRETPANASRNRGTPDGSAQGRRGA